MRTYHWNGEFWYRRDWSLFHRIRNWFIWIGGWEKANGEGWEIFHKTFQGWRIWDPTPISLFGHRVTFFGNWWQMRTHLGYLTVSRVHAYISRDGTTSTATIFYWGAPPDIVRQVQERESDEAFKRWLDERNKKESRKAQA